MLRKLLDKFSPRKARKLRALKASLGFDTNARLPSFVIRGHDLINDLKEKNQARFYTSHGHLKVTLDKLHYNINSWEELYILHEIFFNGVYNLCQHKRYVFLDIGMNAGITSLFFASKNECIEVHGFEPFNRTVELAKENISVNACGEKIKIHPYGLGFPARKSHVQYSEEYKGSMSTKGLGSHITSNPKLETVEIDVLDVANDFSLISTGENSMVVKIDCEGAEYEIIKRLDETHLLCKASCYLVEWHRFGPKQLTDIFIKNGFSVISFHDSDPVIGMLYAFNMASSPK